MSAPNDSSAPLSSSVPTPKSDRATRWLLRIAVVSFVATIVLSLCHAAVESQLDDLRAAITPATLVGPDGKATLEKRDSLRYWNRFFGIGSRITLSVTAASILALLAIYLFVPRHSPRWLILFAALPLGLNIVVVIATAAGGGRLWDNGLSGLWFVIGCVLTLAAGAVARRATMPVVMRVNACVGIAVLAYGPLLGVWLIGGKESAGSAPVQWKVHTSAEGHFRASMPGEPSILRHIMQDRGATFEVHLTRSLLPGEAAFGVLHFPLSPAERYQDPDSIFGDMWRGAEMSLPSLELLSKRDFSVGNIAGREYVFRTNVEDVLASMQGKVAPIRVPGSNKANTTARFRFYIACGRLYWVSAVAPEDKSKQDDVERFLDSFEITQIPFKAPGEIVALCPTTDDLLAAATQEGTVVVWDAFTGEERHRFPGSRSGSGNPRIAGGPESQLAISDGSATTGITVRNAATGALVAEFPAQPKPASAFAFSGRGPFLASAHGATVKWWNLKSRAEITSFTLEHDVVALAYLGDLFVGCADGSVRRFKDSTKEELRALNSQYSRVEALAGDHTRLVIGSREGVHQWDLVVNNVVAGFRPKVGAITHVARERTHSYRILTVGEDVRLWEPNTGEQLMTFDYPGKAVAAVFLPRNRVAVAGGTSEVRVFEIGRR